MICHRQGDAAEARTWLEKAVRWLEAPNKSKPAHTDLPIARILEIQLLRREAEQLLCGSSERPAGSNEPGTRPSSIGGNSDP